MKKIIAFIVVALFLGTGSVSANTHYLGIGTGLQFNLGSLGETISSSGLDSRAATRSNAGAKVGGPGYSACPTVACLEGTGAPQKLVVAENTLISLERSSNQLYRAYTSGPMSGMLLDVFYENQGGGFFYRAGVQYVKKTSGGSTQSDIAGLRWYDIEWDYYAWHIPLYVGVNINISDTGSVYAGAGINYSRGGWNLGGNNIGDVPATLTGTPVGSHTTLNSKGEAASTNVLWEAAKFRTEGFGFNFLIGVDKKLSSADKVYFELETIVNGGQASTVTRSPGGATGLAPVAAYPINLSGTKYKFGYKIEL